MSARAQAAAPDRHLIGEVTFDLALPDKGSGVRDARELAWSLRSEVLPGIEAALDSFAETGPDIALDRLEIDLGDMPIPVDWAAVRRLVEEQLTAALVARGGISTDAVRNRGDAAAQAQEAQDTGGGEMAKPPLSARALSRRAQALATWLDGLPDSAARLSWLTRMQVRDTQSLRAVLQLLDAEPDRLRRLTGSMSATERVRFAALLGQRGAAAKGAPGPGVLGKMLREYLASGAGQTTADKGPGAADTPFDMPEFLARLRRGATGEQIALLAATPAGVLGDVLARLMLEAHDPEILAHLALGVLGAIDIEPDTPVPPVRGGHWTSRRTGDAGREAHREASADSVPPQAVGSAATSRAADLAGAALLRAWRAYPARFAMDIAAHSVPALARLWRIVAAASAVPAAEIDALAETADQQGDTGEVYRDALAALIAAGPVDVPAKARETPEGRGPQAKVQKTAQPEPLNRAPGDVPGGPPDGQAQDAEGLPQSGPPEAAWQALSREAALRLLAEWWLKPAALTAFLDGQDAAGLQALLARLKSLVSDKAEAGLTSLPEFEPAVDETSKAHSISRRLADLARLVLAPQAPPDPASLDRLMRVWRDAPAAFDPYLADRSPEDLAALLHLVRPWTLIGGLPGDLTADPTAVRAAIYAALAGDAAPGEPSKDAMLRRAIAWHAEPSRLDAFLRLADGAEMARWIGAMSDWAGPVPLSASDGPAQTADVLRQLAARVIAFADAEAMARMDGQQRQTASQDAVVAAERRTVLRLIDARLASGLLQGPRNTLAPQLEQAHSPAEVWTVAAGWLEQAAARTTGTEAPLKAGDAAKPDARIGAGLLVGELAGLGRLIAAWRRDPPMLDRFLSLRGSEALARLIRPLAVLADDPGAPFEGPQAAKLLQDILAIVPIPPDGGPVAMEAKAPRLPSGTDPHAGVATRQANPSGLASDEFGMQVPDKADEPGAGTAPRHARGPEGRPDRGSPVAGAEATTGQSTKWRSRRGRHQAGFVPGGAPDQGASGKIPTGGGTPLDTVAQGPREARGIDPPLVAKTPDARADRPLQDGQDDIAEPLSAEGQRPYPAARAEEDGAAKGRDFEWRSQRSASGQSEPQAEADDDAVDRDIDRRSRMLALWRADPHRLVAEVAGYSADDLMSFLAAVLTTGEAGDLPPLWQAVTRGAGASRDARAYLAAVLRRLAENQPVDPQAVAREVDAATMSEMETDSVEPPAEAVSESAAADLPILLSLADLLDAPADTADTTGIWRDELFAAVLAEPGGIARALGSARHGLTRAARLVERLASAELHALADALPRRVPARDRALLRLVWQALPPAMMAPGLSRITRWQFLLLASDGAFARSGGVAGLVGQVLDWLAGRSATRGAMVRALMAGLEARARGPDAGAVAQLVAALKKEPGGEQATLTGAEPDTVEAPEDQQASAALTQGAGLVLLSPYLPRLFERLGLTRGGAFAGDDAVNRAFDLLHHVLHGDAPPIDAPRPLEKLLCGMPAGMQLRPAMRLEHEEQEIVDDMLSAVVTQWSALGNTSIDGLREAFLRREGLLESEDELVRLRVSPKAFDMLLDRLPWSYGVVKFPWMDKPLHVDWRNNDG